jgi:uncharacterized protein YutE (UPF0331/DUF86 family)
MTPLKQEVISRKVRHLEELLGLLKAEEDCTLPAFLADRREQLLVERLLHLCVEASCDLLDHLLVQRFAINAETYADTFLKASQAALISADLAQRLLPAAGLRNRLVHDYDALDPERIHAAIQTALTDLGDRLNELRAAGMGI